VIDNNAGLLARLLRQRGSAGLGAGRADTGVLAYAAGPSADSVAAIDGALTIERGATAWLSPFGGLGAVADDGNAGRLDWGAAGRAGGYERALEVATGEA